VHQILKPWLAALLFLVVMLTIYSAVDRFEFDEDEGVNLIKGMLVAHGYSLYDEIWSDQPPLLTYAFAGIFQLGGPRVETARFLVLVFSSILVWSLLRVTSELAGKWGVATSLLVLITLPGYAKLSISAMVGLPAIALAVAALAAQLSWHRSGANRWLFASGALLALSAMTKLFTLFLVPVFLVGTIAGGIHGIRHRSVVVLYWLAGFLGVAGLIAAFWCAPEASSQLVDPHADAQSVAVYQGQHWFRGFQESSGLLILAGIGAWIQIRRRRWLWLYPTAWMVVGLIILLAHTPVRYHHRLLVTVPAVPLATALVVDSVKLLFRQRTLRAILATGFVVALLGLTGGQHWPRLDRFLGSGDRGAPSRILSEKIVLDMVKNAGEDDWIVTDRPIYAFRAGLLVPPPVAVLTGKRLRTGRMDEAMLMQAVGDFQAREVLLARFEWETLEKLLAEDFQSTSYDKRRTLFVRKEGTQ
jgi:4-amino-4-deoxy-L-arabinose transferase-like glycosyltransferase